MHNAYTTGNIQTTKISYAVLQTANVTLAHMQALVDLQASTRTGSSNLI